MMDPRRDVPGYLDTLLLGLASSLILQGLPSQAVPPVATGEAARQFDLRGVDFRGIGLSRVNFAGRDLSGCFLRDADVTGANFWRTRLDGVDLRGTRGLSAQQLASAVWDPARPPHLSVALNRFRRFWENRRADAAGLAGVNLWGADLQKFNFVDADLRGAVLIGAQLRGAVMLRAKLAGAILAGADISDADLRGAVGLTAGQLVSARWDPKSPPRLADDLNLIRTRFEKKDLVHRDLRGGYLFGSDLAKADLTDCNLRGVALHGSDLRGALLKDADLQGAVLNGALISGADFRGSRGLTAARLVSARWDPQAPPSLDAALNLTRKKFEHRSLAGVNLSGANLWGVDMAKARLQGCDLSGAVFMDASLRGATLVDANLEGAILVGADLSGADLRSAKSFSAGQLLSARWEESNPPKLSAELEVIRKMWKKRDLQGNVVRDTFLWGTDLRGARLHGSGKKGPSASTWRFFVFEQ